MLLLLQKVSPHICKTKKVSESVGHFTWTHSHMPSQLVVALKRVDDFPGFSFGVIQYVGFLQAMWFSRLTQDLLLDLLRLDMGPFLCKDWNSCAL